MQQPINKTLLPCGSSGAAAGKTRLLVVVLACLSVGAGVPSVDPQQHTAAAPGFTREQLESIVPQGPNPYLAYLPAGAEPDLAYWRARMQLESRDRRAAMSRTSARQAVIELSESEPAGALYENDHVLFAEPLTGFGSSAGSTPAARISGHLRALPRSVGPFSEPDGAIPLAHDLGVVAGERVALDASIGDGLYGSGGTAETGDFDYYALVAAAGETIEVAVGTPIPLANLDPIAGLYSSAGVLLATNNNIPMQGLITTYDSYLSYTPDTGGSYYVVVGGTSSQVEERLMFPADPFDPASGPGAGSEGSYRLMVGLAAPDPGDIDLFRIELRAGDVLGATISEGAYQVMLRGSANELLVDAVAGDLSSLYPQPSPLPGGGEATIAWVADRDGTYVVGVSRPIPFADGSYQLELAVYRSPLDAEPAPVHQVLFLDLDGASFDRQIFRVPAEQVTLSPLASFLADWGLDAADEDALIDRIISVVTDNLSDDVRLIGANGDYQSSGVPGEFSIELRNSRDHPDPFGEANVSRVIIGGTTGELEIWTIGLAEAIDPGNFGTEITAVVLLDLLSGPSDTPDSLNGVELAAGASRIDLIGTVLGNIAAHEAGHLFGNYHTERDDGPMTIMDRGGRLANMIGFGEDEIFGTGDDLDIDLGPDSYSPYELFSGLEQTLEVVSFGLATGGIRPQLVVIPGSCDLGALPVGAGSSCVLTLSNEGSSQLELSTVELSGPAAGQYSCDLGSGLLLAPGATRQATVSFAPTSLGSKLAVLSLTSNDPRRPLLEVLLSGQGGVPVAGVTPTAHDFGEIVYGAAGLALTTDLTVGSTGVGDLGVSSLAFTGATPERFRVDAGGAPFVVPSGEQRTITVSFAPGGLVGRASALLRLVSNDPAQPLLDVALSGLSWGAEIEVAPAPSYHFGSVVVGSSRWRSFLVENLGNRDLQVSAVTLSGEHPGDLVLSDPGPFTIGPGGSRYVLVTCTPLDKGARSAVLSFVSNDPDEGSLEIELQVRGVLPEITIEPAACDFSEVEVLSSATCRLLVSNAGDGTLRVDTTALSGTNAAEMAIEAGGGGYLLSGDAVREVLLRLSPETIGDKDAVLSITSNDPFRPLAEVPLHGVAVQPAPDAIPTLSPIATVVLGLLLALSGLLILNRRRPDLSA